ncbi:MAG: 5-oxoprolinase subunit PxpB [Proteobacteria bacterium]|nr:5-oxoprolinase subunit PxpB [Pseudomonadota bacterium]
MSPADPIQVRFLPAGDTALVVEFGDKVDREVSDRVLALADAVEKRAIAGIVEMVPTFRSLMIHYDPLQLGVAEIEAEVRPMLASLGAVHHSGRLWTLPVAYGGDLGPDLGEVAERTRHSPEEIVRKHTSIDYHVYMLGFLPGNPYLGDGPEELWLPRRESPRVKVPMGTVSIAMRLVSIYPLESPGGWHLIGRTPVRLFDRRRPNAVLLAAGDRVRFRPVSREEHDRLEEEAAAGRMQLEPAELAA